MLTTAPAPRNPRTVRFGHFGATGAAFGAIGTLAGHRAVADYAQRSGVQTMTSLKQPHRVVLVIHEDVAATDFTGPMEAFGLANYISGEQHYELLTVAEDIRPLQLAGGYAKVVPTDSFATLFGPVGTLLIAGGPAAETMSSDTALQAFLKRIEPDCSRFGSVCNGSFILAASGLVDGCEIATHWLYADRIQDHHPRVNVNADAVFVTSGKVWSSAGMTTGMDMALALIEADHGRALALEVARHLVLPMKRVGGQSQFSMHLKAQYAELPSIERVQHHIVDNPAGDLSVKALAAIAAMSTRSFLRQFRTSAGATLGDYIADVRLRHACALLERTEIEMKQVALQAGFGTDANMRKVFMRHLGVTPSQYRASFDTVASVPTYARVVAPAQPKRWLHRVDPERPTAASSRRSA
jgi:transcriptional regulator GlxA family with amidase domain